jgi:flagellar motor switch protein FliN/FliY
MKEREPEVGRTIEAAAEAVLVEASRWSDLAPSRPAGEPVGLANLLDVPVRVTVEVGRARVPLAELVALAPGSVVTLDREAHEAADILVNGKVVARGEVVTLDGHYGVRVTSVLAAS